MLQLALLGDPVEHSLSPYLYTTWMREAGIQGSYDALRFPSLCAEMLKDHLRFLVERGYTGFNITSPLKGLAAQVCPNIVGRRYYSSEAINTLVLRKNALGHDVLYGFDTDSEALYQLLQTVMVPPDQFTVVVGGGAMAVLAVAVLRRLGITRIFNFQRHRSTRKPVMFTFPRTFDLFAQSPGSEDFIYHLRQCGLLVNATPGLSAAFAKYLPPNATVLDCPYGEDLMTPFAAATRQRGLKTYTGVDLLVTQAKISFEVFKGNEKKIQWMCNDTL